MADFPTDELPAVDGRFAADWLERDTTPRLVVDRDLKILWQNDAGKTALESGLAVSCAKGCLVFNDTAGAEHWRTVFGALDDRYRRFVVHDSAGDPNVVLGVFSAGRPSAIFLTVVPVTTAFDLKLCGLAERFQLTKAETQVAQMLVDLASPKEAAEALGVSITTVRTHIRRVYGKAAVRSQRELLRLAMSYCMA